MRKTLRIFVACVSLFLFVSCTKDTEHDDLRVDLNTPPQGEVNTTQTITSAILGRAMHFSVYLPPSYNETTTKYPVLYLLHGMSGNYLDWVNNDMATTMNLAISKKTAKEMIVIMPDGLDAFYCNNFNGGSMRYEDFLIQEFFPQIESKYRINATKKGRAIAGLSMGGYGATFHAFKRPEMFCASYSMSGALDIGASVPDIKKIITEKTAEELKNLPTYTLEYGTEDFVVFASNERFDSFLKEKSVVHNYVKRTGAHDWAFWKACLPKTLEMVSNNMQ